METRGVWDKVIVVTGGGNGIGRQVVLELVRRGARVAAVDIRDDSLGETAASADAEDRLVPILLTRVSPRRATHLIYRQMKDLLSG